MAKPSVEQQAEYLRTAARVIGKAPGPGNIAEYKKLVEPMFQALCELHQELVEEPMVPLAAKKMTVGHQG